MARIGAWYPGVGRITDQYPVPLPPLLHDDLLDWADLNLSVIGLVSYERVAKSPLPGQISSDTDRFKPC